MRAEHDTEACLWCRGDGKDHGTLGMGTVRDCPRCEGSGRVYVTNRESTAGRRRVYKGPAPKPGVVAALTQIFAPAKSALPPSLAVAQELTEALKKPGRRAGTRRKKTKKRRKSAGRHAA